ncbi:MAG: glucuronate isomerase [Bacteroidetes bacterium]|nr:glucuronate isomerase [Bacteroidota bacterium]
MFKLHEDRFFDPNPNVREIARELFHWVKDLPIISPHGHVEQKIFADNLPFPNPAELFIIPDHYIFRMLYSQGIPLENLGIPRLDGSKVESDPRKIWQIFADNYFLFAGTPTGVWLDYEFNIVFGIDEKLNSQNARSIYDSIIAKLNTPEYLPRNLYKKFNIEVLTTTDAASDNLEHHKAIIDSGWDARIIPCFRPDAVVDISKSNWLDNLNLLSESVGYEITDFDSYLKALKDRREYFIKFGAVSSDHGVNSVYTIDLPEYEVKSIFKRALNGKSDKFDAEKFTGYMLIKFAEMSLEDDLVMQIHSGARRNHNEVIFEKFGADKGCDIPERVDFTNNLKPLLNKYGNDKSLSLILFTLDESTYSRELAPLAGHYPAVKLGPAWWFHDSIEGMMRYRKMTTETAGFYNTVGFNDDTRAFVSIPARHDLARRIDSNYLAQLTAQHIISVDEAKKLIVDLSYNLVKKAYRL